MKTNFRLGALAGGLTIALSLSITPTVVSADSRMTSLGEHVAEESTTARAGWDPSTGVSKEAWASAVEDETVKIDESGRVFVVEPRLSIAEVAASTTAAAPVYPEISLANAFTLHSRPGSSKVIYLDFTGHDVTGSHWDSVETFGANSRALPGYSIDGNFEVFSTTERQYIIETWSAVAEDFAVFDIDVTTEEPLQSEIDRADFSDDIFGIRAVITDETNPIAADCGCGGIAYVDVFDYPAAYFGDESYSPALAFVRSSFNGKTISDIVSHEVGHNLGLLHDGEGSDEYYMGRNGWAPIMGAGYQQPLVQWSNGDYSNSTNPQDDLNVINESGVSYIVDDHGGTAGTATLVQPNSTTDGMIRGRTDTDYFRFVPTSTSFDVDVSLPSSSPNLDVALTVYGANGTSVVATASPEFSRLSASAADGIEASVTVASTPGQTYFIKVDGVGFGLASGTGYSDYGSLGDYRVTVASSEVLEQITPVPTPTISGQLKLGRKLSVAIGTWPSGVTTTQQWLRNGSTISGATKSRYKLKTTDLRKRITVRVTATKLGYSTATVTSDPTKKVRR